MEPELCLACTEGRHHEHQSGGYAFACGCMQCNSEKAQEGRQRWYRRIICAFKGHDILAWEDPIPYSNILVEFWECGRCGEFLGVGDVKQQ